MPLGRWTKNKFTELISAILANYDCFNISKWIWRNFYNINLFLFRHNFKNALNLSEYLARFLDAMVADWWRCQVFKPKVSHCCEFNHCQKHMRESYFNILLIFTGWLGVGIMWPEFCKWGIMSMVLKWTSTIKLAMAKLGQADQEITRTHSSIHKINYS